MSRVQRIVTSVAASVVVVTAGFEGFSELAYQDSAGVWTICYGETHGVTQGMRKTKEECNELLAKSLIKHSRDVQKLPDDTPITVVLGSMDFAYNIGVSGFRNSTVYKELLKGNYSKAGQAVLRWKYITYRGKKYDCSTPNNKVCSGLWKRRLWQSQVIGNRYKSLHSACSAAYKILGNESPCDLEELGAVEAELEGFSETPQ